MRKENRTRSAKIRLKIVKLGEIEMGWCSSGCRSKKVRQSPASLSRLTHEVIREDGRNRGSRGKCCSLKCAEKLAEEVRLSEDVPIRPHLYSHAPTEYGKILAEKNARKVHGNGTVRDLPEYKAHLRK